MRYPALADEWHPTKNGNTTAHDVGYASNFERWWLCSVDDCDHEWKASPAARTRAGRGGRGCPPCGQRRGKTKQQVPMPGNELAVRCPDVAKEWHPTKNGTVIAHDVGYASHLKRWWLCSVCGNAWPATPQNRCIGWKNGCPRCSMWGTSAQEIRLRHELAAAGCPVEHPYPPIEVSGRRPVKGDIVCPTWRVVIEFDGYQFHRRPANIERDLNQTHALERAGWTVVRVREELPLLGPNDVQIKLHASEMDAAKAVVEQLAKLGFDTPGASRYLKTGAPWAEASADTEIHRVLSYSLAATAPAFLDEWHPTKNGTVTPDQVHPGSNTAYWWLCRECKHAWPANPITRRNHGCEVCGRKRAAKARARPESGKSLADLTRSSSRSGIRPRTSTAVRTSSGREAAGESGGSAAAAASSGKSGSPTEPLATVARAAGERHALDPPSLGGSLGPVTAAGVCGVACLALPDQGGRVRRGRNGQTADRGCPLSCSERTRALAATCRVVKTPVSPGPEAENGLDGVARETSRRGRSSARGRVRRDTGPALRTV